MIEHDAPAVLHRAGELVSSVNHLLLGARMTEDERRDLHASLGDVLVLLGATATLLAQVVHASDVGPDRTAQELQRTSAALCALAAAARRAQADR